MSLAADLRTQGLLAVDPVRAHDRLVRERRTVVTFGIPPVRLTYLLGPAANAFVFAHSELFTWREAFESLIVVDGETALIVSDGDDHRRRRRLVTSAFGPRQVARYRETMTANAHRVVDGWRPGDRVDLYVEFRRAIRRATIEVLFGARLVADEPAIAADLQPGLELTADVPAQQALRRRLRTPAWRRAVTGRERVAARVRAEIATRAEAGDDDVLGALLAARQEDGSRLSESEVVDQVISLIAAGYETTSAAFGWLGHRLLTEPSVAEHPVEHVVAEVLRLHPPAVVSARMTAVPFTLDGVDVPRGRLVLFSPYVTHRSASVWPDPLRFDPARWRSATPGPHEFLPFGGGPHRCIGARFATTELEAMFTVLRDRAVLRPEHVGTPRAVDLAAMRPRGGIPARVVSCR